MTIPFYDELAAERDKITPILRGLEDLDTFSLGPDAKKAVEDARDNYSRRKGLIQCVLRDIDALILDGFPLEPDARASIPILAELKQQTTDVTLAIAAFVIEATATTLSVNLGTVADKP